MSDCDVIVIAGGAAGLCAAVSAAQAGARVRLFEKNAITGGTANRGMGPLGIESRHTRQRQMKPTRDEAFKAFMDYTHWRVDAALVRAYLERSGTRSTGSNHSGSSSPSLPHTSSKLIRPGI